MRYKKQWLTQSPTSNPISRWARPIFEAKRIKAIFGSLFTFGGLMTASAVYFPVGGYNMPDLNPDQADIQTIITAKPLPAMTGVSQGFSIFHPGIDLTAPEGSEIRPLKSGKVVEIGTLQTGYGRYVVIDHGDGLVTLYAHMGKVMVEEGEEVNQETKLGEVGMTGRTTGPHLHFEVRIEGRAVNPRLYLY